MRKARFIKLVALLLTTGLALGSAAELRAGDKQKRRDAKAAAKAESNEKASKADQEQKSTADKGAKAASVKGKIIVIGPDGKKREIGFGDGSNIVAGVQAGDAKFAGKVIVVGPDGEKVEHQLGDPAAMAEMFKAMGKGVGVAGRSAARPFAVGRARLPLVGKFVVGLFCTPASETLRAHLDLPTGQGLVVRRVFEGTPAAKSGIEEHDILLKAGDKELGSVKDLYDAVQESGTKAVTFTLIRGGKQRNVDVAPVERESTDVAADVEKKHRQIGERLKELDLDISGGDLRDLGIDLGGGRIALQLEGDEISPKVWEQIRKSLQAAAGPAGADESSTEALQKQMKKLSRQLDQLRQEVEKLKAAE